MLSIVPYNNVNRQVKWSIPIEDVKEKSKVFQNFRQELLETMAQDELAFHYHNYSVWIEDYHTTSINEIFNISSHDELQDKPFLNVIEGKRYPFYGLMYHPEYHLMEFVNPDPTFNTLNTPETQEIFENISLFIKNEAMKNSNTFKHMRDLENLLFDNFYYGVYNLNGYDLTYAYGLSNSINKIM